MSKWLIISSAVVSVGLGAAWWFFGPANLTAARALVEKGQHDEAIALLRPIVREDPDYGEAQLLLGTALYGASIEARDTDLAGSQQILQDTLGAFDRAVARKDISYRARVYQAVAGMQAGDRNRSEAILVEPAEEAIEQFGPVRAELLMEQGQVAKALELEQTFSNEPGTFEAVLASDSFDSTSMLVLQPTTGRCEAREAFTLARGEAYDLSGWQGGQPGFTMIEDNVLEGWMVKDAWEDRQRWGKQRYLRSEYAGEPYVFEGNLQDCAGAQGIRFSLEFQARSAPARRLFGRELETVQPTGGTRVTRWHNVVGECTYTIEWLRVRWKKPVTIWCSADGGEGLARGTGSTEEDRARFALAKAAPWPVVTTERLLRGELAQGLTVAMAQAAVGSLELLERELRPQVMVSTWRASQINAHLVFEDGRLVRWEPPENFDYEPYDEYHGGEEF